MSLQKIKGVGYMGKVENTKEFVEGRQAFLGTIEASKSPCTCDSCKKGNDTRVGNGNPAVESWHIDISPLSVYQKHQYIWLRGKTTRSNLYIFLKALETAGIKIEDTEELEGDTFLFVWKITGKNTDGSERGMYVITKKLSKDELNAAIGLGSGDTRNVEA